MPASPLPSRCLLGLLLGGLLLLLAGCGSTRPYTLGPIKTTDPDDRPTPRPEETVESMYWDRVDLSVFHQVEKPFNLNWTGRKVGQALGWAGPDEADNVNVMDEPPTSSWWTRRHFYDGMSPRELAIGPNREDSTGLDAGPVRTGPWTVTGGKMEGAARGFQIKDAAGNRFLIKLDGPHWPELATSAEVISTKIFHAAGYHVPQNTITSFTLDRLEIADDAEIRVGSQERPMTRADLEQLLAPYERGPGGSIRGMASAFVQGDLLGPFSFQGTRDGDANDRVRHEQRRELRGLRVIGSWLNDADRRAANTLAVYTDERYVKHYLIDMGSTLGANADAPHRPIHGQAYLIDQRKILTSLFALGASRFPWWSYDPTPPYKAVGYYPAEVFDPEEWVPTYPNPAFEKCTARDGYWGAKIVMGFSDEDLAAIVETAQISNPEAEAHLLEVLQKRRDKVGRYWFDRVNPLDRFTVATPVAGPARLQFEDLSVQGHLEPAAARRYAYRLYLDGTQIGPSHSTDRTALPLAVDGTPLGGILEERGRSTPHERVVRVTLRTRQGGDVSPRTDVYVHVPSAGTPRVVGLRRHSVDR